MRSAFKVFSLSASAPQTATILSSSLAAIAATQGAGSACGSVGGSVLVAANAPCGSDAHRIKANGKRRQVDTLMGVLPPNAGTHTPCRLVLMPAVEQLPATVNAGGYGSRLGGRDD